METCLVKTFSLHDALPISQALEQQRLVFGDECAYRRHHMDCCSGSRTVASVPLSSPGAGSNESDAREPYNAARRSRTWRSPDLVPFDAGTLASPTPASPTRSTSTSPS